MNKKTVMYMHVPLLMLGTFLFGLEGSGVTYAQNSSEGQIEKIQNSTSSNEHASDSKSNSTSSIPPSATACIDSVTPGLLEDSRKTLLTEIEEAKEHGVGIQPYMAAFRDIESMVRIGETQEKIQLRLKQITKSLKSQLLDQMTIGFSSSANNLFLADSKNSRGMPLQQARAYMLALVNQERARYSLSPLTFDSIATAAAQMHSDEMARVGYSGHWDCLGRKPSQRYSELGGVHNVGENIVSHCLLFRPDKLDNLKDHQFTAIQLSKMEAEFMNELPPDNGHRLETLRPEHNKLGIGLSYAANAAGEWFATLDQEFLDEYGTYSKLPNKIVRDKSFVVSGSLYPGVTLYSISIRWEAEPRPMTRQELWMCPHHYAEAETIVADHFPENNGPIKIWEQNGRQQFSTRLVPSHNWKPGLYYIQIWAAKNGEVILVSNRRVMLKSCGLTDLKRWRILLITKSKKEYANEKGYRNRSKDARGTISRCSNCGSARWSKEDAGSGAGEGGEPISEGLRAVC